MENVSAIVDKLRDNPIGIAGLAILILGFLANTYFAKEKDWRVKFGSMAFVGAGLAAVVWAVFLRQSQTNVRGSISVPAQMMQFHGRIIAEQILRPIRFAI